MLPSFKRMVSASAGVKTARIRASAKKGRRICFIGDLPKNISFTRFNNSLFLLQAGEGISTGQMPFYAPRLWLSVPPPYLVSVGFTQLNWAAYLWTTHYQSQAFTKLPY